MNQDFVKVEIFLQKSSREYNVHVGDINGISTSLAAFGVFCSVLVLLVNLQDIRLVLQLGPSSRNFESHLRDQPDSKSSKSLANFHEFLAPFLV